MMDDNEVRLNEPLPAPVIEGVRAAYAAPAGEAYWMSLEARIMARIADASTARWWVVLGTWARGGIVAAAAVLVAAVVGLLMLHARDQELRTAYESATRPPAAESIAVPSGALSERDGPDTRGATFRDVISQ
jgi:hypothetical protein